VPEDASQSLIREMHESFERLETVVAELHPTDEADPAAKAELIADLSGNSNRCAAG
jgi:hypothetical protein